ncbi:MAG: MNIO family bufferin maturase [Gammaproteobacteria bacterium]
MGGIVRASDHQWNSPSDESLVPAAAGIGLKPAHYEALLAERPSVAFLEAHTENYMGAGGPPHRYLEALAELYPLSFHGVGLSLGGVAPLDRAHLVRWRELVARYSPVLVSEHVAWSDCEQFALHDLLPIPYTEEALKILCDHIDEMQMALGRKILIENPSGYLEFRQSAIPEPEFLMEAARRTGCGLLLDINNVYVSTQNRGEDVADWLVDIPGDLVGEIHLAGHTILKVEDQEIRIDDHGSRVAPAVWALYRETVARIGRRPTLIEWDTDVPDIHVLLEEAARADQEAAGLADEGTGDRNALSH